MQFRDIVGQQEIKSQLKSQVDSGRLPHALLLAGDTGYGTMALALALANYVMCGNHIDGDSCGICPECTKFKKLIHPDLHFSFPLIKKSSGITTCDTYMREWREHLVTDKYFDLNDWLAYVGSDNKQAIIPEAESDNIIRKLSLSSYEGGWKIMIIWLPERMNASAANNILKILEEPTRKTLFILCSERPEDMLTTILSRTQRIDVPPLSAEEIRDVLVNQRGVDPAMALNIARVSGGSYLRALRHLCSNDDSREMLDNFIQLMRIAYVRNMPEIMKWCDKMSALGREQQKLQLAYMQRMLRENFMYNFNRPELNYMTVGELEFATKFARFINERNIIRFMEEFSRAQRDVAGNVNSKSAFFNLALKTIILLRS